MLPMVAVLVINWNGADETRACVSALLATSYARKRICVVDNGSGLDESAILAREFPGLDTLRLPDNIGYAGAGNAGVRWARAAGADYICMLNNDTTVEPDFLDVLVRASEELGRHAVLTPLILRPDGRVWSAGGRLDWPKVAGEHVGIGGDPDDFRERRIVDWASGCALFASASTFAQAGPLDERFFLYLEDVEWCLRARRRGVVIHYVPEARIWHGVTKTIGRIDPRISRYYAYRNYYLLGFRHSSPLWKAWFSAHLCFTLAKAGLRNLLSARYRADAVYNARTRALLDVVAGRRGKAPYEHRLEAPPVSV